MKLIQTTIRVGKMRQLCQQNSKTRYLGYLLVASLSPVSLAFWVSVRSSVPAILQMAQTPNPNIPPTIRPKINCNIRGQLALMKILCLSIFIRYVQQSKGTKLCLCPLIAAQPLKVGTDLKRTRQRIIYCYR